MLNLYRPYWEPMPVILNSGPFDQFLEKKEHVEYLLHRFFGIYCPIFIHEESQGFDHHANGEGIHLHHSLFERSIASILNVAAHEYGHIYLAHVPERNPFHLEHINQLFEIEADIFAAVFLALNQVSLQPSLDHFSKISDSSKKGRVHLKSGCRMDILEHHYCFARDFLQGASIPELIEYIKAAAFHDFQYYSLDPSNFGDIHRQSHRHLHL